MNPSLENLDDILREDVRVEDFLVAKLLGSMSQKRLSKFWPYSHAGMPRATRMPLGHAAKIWVVASTRDVDGNVVEEGETSWYYMWWRGIHCLMGRRDRLPGSLQFGLPLKNLSVKDLASR